MKTIFGFLLVLFSACSALADSTVYVIAKAQSEIDGIDAQISTERAKSACARAVLAARAKDFNPIKTRHDTLQRQYAIDADAYNRNCAGRPVSYGSSPSWRAKVLAEQQQLTPLLADMERRANELSRQGQQLSNEQVFFRCARSEADELQVPASGQRSESESNHCAAMRGHHGLLQHCRHESAVRKPAVRRYAIRSAKMHHERMLEVQATRPSAASSQYSEVRRHILHERQS